MGLPVRTPGVGFESPMLSQKSRKWRQRYAIALGYRQEGGVHAPGAGTARTSISTARSRRAVHLPLLRSLRIMSSGDNAADPHGQARRHRSWRLRVESASTMGVRSSSEGGSWLRPVPRSSHRLRPGRRPWRGRRRCCLRASGWSPRRRRLSERFRSLRGAVDQRHGLGVPAEQHVATSGATSSCATSYDPPSTVFACILSGPTQGLGVNETVALGDVILGVDPQDRALDRTARG